MRRGWSISGLLFLVIGTIWIVYVMGAVFSHTQGFTRLGELWGAIAFHVVFTGLGVFALSKGVAKKATA